jgi:acetyl esterase/lipase
MDRRTILGMAGALVSGSANAQKATGSQPGDPDEFIALWPGTPPGGAGVKLTLKVTDDVLPDGYHVRVTSQIQTPGFFVYRPARPKGLGLLIIPGGGYAGEGHDRGGREIAEYFAALGITCFVLRYRLPGEGWENRETVALQDAQRAMRLIRSGEYNVDPSKLAVIGFSAGGHVSAALATRHALPVYTAVSTADGRDAKPLTAVHMYPVITMGEGAHPGSREKLLGKTPSPEAVDAWSLERHVGADAVPSFICLAADDDVVPPLPNGVAFFIKLREAKIASEIHVFETGGHAFGLARGAWPEAFLSWAATHGFKA